MSKIALAAAVVALTVALLAKAHAEAPPPAHFVPPPGAAPPWADATTATTQTPQAQTSTATPAATSMPASVATLAPVSAAPPLPDASGTMTPSAVAATPSPVTATPMQGATTPIHVVSLRAGPSGSAPVIGTLHPGDQLEILATANYGWTQVRSPAGTGWAYGSYLAQGGSAAAVPSPAAPQEIISR
jgi:hypothetical protein